jgi:tetratricopeptide (TPR) repeat protein
VQSPAFPRSVRLVLLALSVFWIGPPGALRAETPAELEAQLQKLSNAGQHREAIAYGEARWEAAGPSAKVHQLLADAYYEIDDGDGTRRHAQKALELDPANEMAARLYVCACRDQDRYEEGLKLGRDWVAANPGGGDIYKDLALLAHDAGRIEEATALAAEAFRRKPAHPRIAGVHFYFQCITGDTVVAADAARQWAEENKPEAYFWAQLGKGLSDAEKAREALPFLERALQEGSTDRGVPGEIMDCYRTLGDRAAAAKFIQSYGATHEVHASLWRTFGAIHYDAEAYGEALTAFEKSRRLDPDNPSTVANIIFTLIEVKRAQEGIEEGQRWMNYELSTATPGFHRAMGNAYFARDRWLEAEPHYREAVRLDHTRIQDVRELVTVLAKQGRVEDAVIFGRKWQSTHADEKDNGLEEQIAKAEKRLLEADSGSAAKSG